MRYLQHHAPHGLDPLIAASALIEIVLIMIERGNHSILDRRVLRRQGVVHQSACGHDMGKIILAMGDKERRVVSPSI